MVKKLYWEGKNAEMVIFSSHYYSIMPGGLSYLVPFSLTINWKIGPKMILNLEQKVAAWEKILLDRRVNDSVFK